MPIAKTTPLTIDLPELVEPDEESAAANGETSIISGLFRAQANKVRRYLTYRLQNADDGKDATQDLFLKLWRRERAGQLRREATAYMYSTSHTVAIDADRHRSYHDRDRLTDVDLDTLPGDSCSAEERHYWRKAIAHLVNNMEALPDFTRNVFVMHHFDGLNYSQIAAKLDVSLRTVERHIARGTKELRARMKEYL